MADPALLDKAFGLALRDARATAGMSQEGLAEAASLHRTYISQMERGLKSPSLRVMKALADALGITVVSLVGKAVGES